MSTPHPTRIKHVHLVVVTAEAPQDTRSVDIPQKHVLVPTARDELAVVICTAMKVRPCRHVRNNRTPSKRLHADAHDDVVDFVAMGATVLFDKRTLGGVP